MNFKEDKQQAAEAAQYEANLATYKNWLGKHSEIVECEANLKAFQDYLDWSDEFTEADLDFALGNLTSRLRLATQKPPTPAEVKQQLIDQICLMIASADSTGRDGKFSAFSLKAERTKMQFWSIQQLTARLEEVVRKQQLSKLSAPELQKIVESGRRYVGYPALGKSIVPPGKVRAVPLNGEYLRGLDAYDLKRLCRLYGSEQVNAKLRD